MQLIYDSYILDLFDSGNFVFIREKSRNFEKIMSGNHEN